MASNFFKEIGDKLADFVDWVKETMEDEAIRKSIAEDLGLEPGAPVPEANLPQDKLDSINRYRSQANPDKEAFIVLLNDVRDVYQAARGFISAVGISGVSAVNQSTYTLFDLMALNYFRLYLPELYFGIHLLSTLVEDSSALEKDELEVRRFLKAILNAVSFFFSPFYFVVTSLKSSSEDEEQARRASEGLFALVAAMLSMFVTREISYGWDSFEDPAQFRVTGFKDPARFTAKLKDANNPLSQHLIRLFGAETKQLLDQHDPGAPSKNLQSALIADLNRVLGGPSLFEKERFAQVKLSNQTLRLVDSKPLGKDLVRLNWLLLEEAYPAGIARSATPAADVISDRMLTFAFPFEQTPSSGSELDQALKLSMAIKPKSEPDITQGLFIGVGGNASVEIGLTDKWKFLIQASADPAFSLLFDASNLDITAQGPTDAPLNVALVSIPDESDVTYAFPDDSATRIEVGQIAFSFTFDGRTGGIKAEAQRCALVFGTKDPDGFLSKVLPKDGLRVPFNFGTGFSTDKGFFTEGNIPWLSGRSTGPLNPPAPRAFLNEPGGNGGRRARSLTRAGESPEIPNLSGTKRPELGIQQVIEIGKTILTLRLNQLLLGLSPATDTASAEAKMEVSVSLDVKIGPVTAIIDRVGFQLGLSFPESGGNAGFADFSMGFKPPNGVGIKVNLPTVTGGGFLFLDHDKAQYAGFVQLIIHDLVTVTAIGLITTRLPNGEKGFSCVFMIMVEDFRPLCLGLGFTLTAIGGLVAINRTCNTDFLREGLKNKTLDSILFPQDPIRNAVQIFGTLNNAFPPVEGSHLAGIMVQICWGTPPIITMNLGVIMEVGNRTRLIILGQVKAIMPTEKQDLIRLQMNAMGVVDWDLNTVEIDAVLYDSRLVGKFPITGSMAMRLRWGSDPMFALSIGGFHPAFKPPANFPTLQRLAISFANSENFRLRAEAYVAVTSNTLQLGARLELFAKAGGFSVEGRLGLDVLIQFDPFFFRADFLLSAQLKRGSRNLFKVKVEGVLSGPRPLNVKGKATFEILWCDFSVSFDKTLVSGEKPPKLAAVEVMSQLKVALNDSRNWSGQISENVRRMVSLRDSQAADQIALHPLGQLSVKQTVVPLDLEISKFGSTTPAGARLFKINQFSVNGKEVSFQRVKDFFPPSQFLDLTDEEKLAAPSFEPMMAGISAGADSFVFTTNDNDILEDEAITFETIVLDKEHKASRPAPSVAISPQLLTRTLSFGAAARSEVRRTGPARYHTGIVRNFVVKKGWTIASASDGSAQDAPGFEAGKVVSYSESFQALQKMKQENPARAKTMMLVRVNVKN